LAEFLGTERPLGAARVVDEPGEQDLDPLGPYDVARVLLVAPV
jgi:hypothetical protein